MARCVAACLKKKKRRRTGQELENLRPEKLSGRIRVRFGLREWVFRSEHLPKGRFRFKVPECPRTSKNHRSEGSELELWDFWVGGWCWGQAVY